MTLFGAYKTMTVFAAETEDRWENIGQTGVFGMPLVVAYEAAAEHELVSVPVHIRLVETDKPLATSSLFSEQPTEAKVHDVELLIPARRSLVVGLVN